VANKDFNPIERNLEEVEELPFGLVNLGKLVFGGRTNLNRIIW